MEHRRFREKLTEAHIDYMPFVNQITKKHHVIVYSPDPSVTSVEYIFGPDGLEKIEPRRKQREEVA